MPATLGPVNATISAHGLSVGYLLLGAGVLLFSVLAIWRFDSRDLAV